MADGQQYDTSQLDTVQHPTLGPLRFPHDMPFEERNSMIADMEKQASPPKEIQKPSPEALRYNAQPTKYEQENTPSFWGEAARTAAKIPFKTIGLDTDSHNAVTDWLKQNGQYLLNAINPNRVGPPKMVGDIVHGMNDLSREGETVRKSGQSVEPVSPAETGAFQTRPGGPTKKLGAQLEHPQAAGFLKEALSAIPVVGPGISKAGHTLARAQSPQEIGEGMAEAGGTVGQALLPTEQASDLGNTLSGKFKSAALDTASKVLRDPKTGKITITPHEILERTIPQRPEIAAREATEARNATFEQRAQDLQRRGREQSRIDKQTARQAGERDATKLNEPFAGEEVPGPEIWRDATRQNEPFAGEQESEDVPRGTLQRPSSGPPQLPSEGRPATWTNETVRELASWGDPDAIEQARARGFGRIPLKYESVQTNPKSVTSFTQEGQPVEQPPVTRPQTTYKPSEKATTMSGEVRNLGPEFNAQQWQEEISRNEAVLRNPRATPDEVRIASDRLRDARENMAKELAKQLMKKQ